MTPPDRARPPLSERHEALLLDLADGAPLAPAERLELEGALGGAEPLARAAADARRAAALARRLAAPAPPPTLAPAVLRHARRRRRPPAPAPRPPLELWAAAAAVLTLVACWATLATQRRAREARLAGELRPVTTAPK